MNRESRICIWYEPGREYGLRWWRQPAYCWSCPCGPRMKGRNSFNRFTDMVKRGRSHYVHPYKRCWNAVELHIWRYHRDGRGHHQRPDATDGSDVQTA